MKSKMSREASKVLRIIQSQKRVLAARRNGKKGGRPKKEETYPPMYTKVDLT